jgi:acyl-CoA synthetase (AMP-forming)/AMP-acid ligase II
MSPRRCSTGPPKGALFSEALTLPTEGSAQLQPFVRFDFASYDPTFVLSLLSTLHCGGSRALCSGLDALLTELPLAAPTHIGATPVYWTMLHGLWRERVGGIIAAVPGTAPADAERSAAAYVKSLLGRRLQLATSGGAPLAPSIMTFVRETLHVDLVSLYGTRETGGIARDGVVYAGVDVRLLPMPSLGLDGVTRGEVAVCSPRLIQGYFKNPDADRAFVELEDVEGSAGGGGGGGGSSGGGGGGGDGARKRYYRTGDVGELSALGTFVFTTKRDCHSCRFYLGRVPACSSRLF